MKLQLLSILFIFFFALFLYAAIKLDWYLCFRTISMFIFDIYTLMILEKCHYEVCNRCVKYNVWHTTKVNGEDFTYQVQKTWRKKYDGKR